MRAFVGITDKDWFEFLSGQPHLEEINFWQPSGRHVFKALNPGELFLFKLHYPENCIVGGGFFAHASLLSINLAWETFGTANGARSFSEMRQRVSRYKKVPDAFNADYTIGCIILVEPFFLQERDWITVPDWSPSIVQGKTYDLTVDPGFSIWTRLHMPAPSTGVGARESRAPYGNPVLVAPRLGQGAFRIAVTDAYQRRCAVTGEKTLPALDAAHIKPYAESGEHAVSNGLLLRRDLHALFDQGYVTINPEMRFEVSSKIKEEFENGHDYYNLHGSKIWLPSKPGLRPDAGALAWHNENKYKG